MEITCYMQDCSNRPSFMCRCKTPSVFICDLHFSIHIKTKGLSHQYEFLSVHSQKPVPSPSISPQKAPIRNAEIQKLLDSLPTATKQSLYKASALPANPGDLLSKLPANAAPRRNSTEKIEYGEGYYEGQTENNKEHGSGVYVGECNYSGDWRYGLPHGVGELSYKGCKYVGGWAQGMITGIGRLEIMNGDVYEGNFCDGKFQGNGVYMFKDSVQCSGYFRDHYLICNEFLTLMPYYYITLLDSLNSAEVTIPKRFAIICNIFNTPLYKFEPAYSYKTLCKFFKNNSFTLVTIDFETYEKSETTLSSTYKFSFLAGICEIQGMIFHAGGLIGEKCTGHTFLFNPDINEITWLESCYKRSTTCAVNINRKVYVFGGADIFLNFISSAEVYDFDTYKWSGISQLPAASDSMAGTSYGKLAIVSGYMHTRLYIYDSDFEKYFETFELPDFKEKVLCVGQGKVFLFCNRKMFECKTGNAYEWKAVRDVVYTSGWCIGNPICKATAIYWYTTDKEIWKFDLDTKGLFLLKKFK